MDKNIVRDYLQKALAELDRPDTISTPAQFDAALASGATSLVLANSFVYSPSLTLSKQVSITTETPGQGRMTFDEPAPKFLNGITVTGPKISLSGIEISSLSPLGNIVNMNGQETRLDRVRILGDPIKGSHRGIYYAGSFGFITNSYVDYIFQPAQDTQAIYSQEMGPGGLLIDNCWLAAAGQSIMFGGGDPPSQDRVPAGITITNSTLTKRPEWIVMTNGKHAQQVKCALEFKNCIGVKVDNCVLEYGGISMGQGGYLIDATPRNQGNTAPYTSVQDVTITNCTGGHASGIVNFLGSDNVNPSGPLARFTLKDCHFTDIDHAKLPGTTGRLFMFDRSPQGVTLDGVVVEGANVAALGYFTGAPPTGLVVSNTVLPVSKYGWKIDGSRGGGSGRKALLVYMPDAVLDAGVI